jgi:hypothetical protein
LYPAADAAKTIVGLEAAENPEPNPSSLEIFQSPNRNDMLKPKARKYLHYILTIKDGPGKGFGVLLLVE